MIKVERTTYLGQVSHTVVMEIEDINVLNEQERQRVFDLLDEGKKAAVILPNLEVR